jgi:L-rhamnose isomerase/sugar isomerase
VVNIQVAYAQALVIDRAKLAQARQEGDVILAEETLLEAYRTDVRPLLAAAREEMGAPVDPLAPIAPAATSRKFAPSAPIHRLCVGLPGA